MLSRPGRADCEPRCRVVPGGGGLTALTASHCQHFSSWKAVSSEHRPSPLSSPVAGTDIPAVTFPRRSTNTNTCYNLTTNSRNRNVEGKQLREVLSPVSILQLRTRTDQAAGKKVRFVGDYFYRVNAPHNSKLNMHTAQQHN